MISNYSEKSATYIWNFLKSKGLNDFAIAGVLGNLYCESRLIANNVQNSYTTRTGITDEQYTKSVDDGTYKNFKSDKVGYGLAQWTSVGRKTKMLAFIQSKGASIGDLSVQCEWLWEELNTSYKAVVKALNNATCTRDSAEAFVCKFEVPASVIAGGTSKENCIKTRTSYADDFYNKFHTATPEEVEKPVFYVAKAGDSISKLIKLGIVKDKQDFIKKNKLSAPYWLYIGRTYIL